MTTGYHIYILLVYRFSHASFLPAWHRFPPSIKWTINIYLKTITC